ncbi:hypothetical protein BG015_006326 [Linnemannia schmuckeri]|uniref:Uncharacterized protein n=1 Tax=Linnemannia schmuckeri TaxID=64567 RepID=A0A9P5S916_9FUNG|nr:hypothetical protein BG015_006326 [Linnemannia schmuckeri]
MLLGLGCSVVLMLAEIFVGVTLLLTKDWALRVMQTGLLHTNNPLPPEQQQQQQPQSTSSLPPTVADMLQRLGAAACWIVIGSTGLTLCVMLWDWTKARSIVQSESIPQAFLNTPAFRLWGIKSYTHFCLLSKIRWGRTIRQRFVMMIYFGLQGFTAVLVSIPRLMVYASILLAAKNIPDLATSQQGFQAIQLASFAALKGILLKAALAVMALSTILHGLHLVRIVLAGVVCTFSLCYLGRMRKTMARDLESRITSLVGSTSYRGRNGSQTSQDGMSTRNDMKTTSQDQHQEHSMGDNAFQLNSGITVSFVSEKSLDGRPQSVSELNPSNGRRPSQDVQDMFYQIDLGQQHSHAPMDPPADRPLTPGFRLYPSSSDAFSLVNLSLSERKQSQPAFSHSPQPAQPSITTTSNNTNGPHLIAPAPNNPNFSTRCQQQQTEALNEEAAQRNTIDQLVPNNRLAALSFYDDLLKSINSERMIYANQAIVDVRQSIHGLESTARRESHNPSVNSPSIALCSSIPLTYSSCSEYDDRHSTDRPVHPFDIGPSQSRFPTPGSAQDMTVAIGDIYMHPLDLMDIQGGLEINFQSRPGSQESLHAASFRDLQRASRCGSSHSQETIENWRIHVAPSSPVIPEIDFGMQDGHQQRRQSTTPTSTAERYDGYNNSKDMEGEPDSRRGTIPIILSSHLQEAAAMFQDDQDDYDMTDDLHVPRPFYAYGQGRSQRQGSIQSSVGGYNYSTAASSPSLADSLSNPMYQQQANEILNATGGGYPRAFPPRKGSLPCSISSSLLEDATTPRGPQFVYQQQQHQTQSQNSFLSAHSALPAARTRPKAPSHLSNMVSRADGLVGDFESSSSFQANRGHVRSQSQGSRSTTNRGSSWDQLGALKGAQAGYATLIDIPVTSVSHMDYQFNDDDDDFMLRESVRMSIKAGMSLKEALAIDNLMYRNSMLQPQQQQQPQHGLPSSSFSGEIDDKMVHPLDLSPLILQTARSGTQQQSYDYPIQQSSPVTVMSSSTVAGYVPPRSHDSPSTAAQQAWDETCIGLGLTMTTPTPASTRYQESHHAHAHQAPTSENCSLPRRPIPFRYHQQLDRSGDSFVSPPQQYQQQPLRRPEMTTKSVSGLTTHTLQSDATLNSGSYSYATSATSSTSVDMSFTNHHYSSYASHYPMSSSATQNNKQHATNDYDQDTTHTYPHHHRHYQQHPQQQQQQPQQSQLDRQYSYSQHHVGGDQEPLFFRGGYNNPPVQRQSSQRNKKNLVVNISPNHNQIH